VSITAWNPSSQKEPWSDQPIPGIDARGVQTFHSLADADRLDSVLRGGDVANVVFSCGWIPRDDGGLLIYYGASDTRIHVARTTVDMLVDHVKNTPEDGTRSPVCVKQRIDLIEKNVKLMKEKDIG